MKTEAEKNFDAHSNTRVRWAAVDSWNFQDTLDVFTASKRSSQQAARYARTFEELR